MGIDTEELRAGLARTAPYLLSHHQHEERYRCYAPVVRGRRIHLCARCTGIYPGIAAGLLAAGLGPASLSSIWLVSLLPLPALLEWLRTGRGRRRGSNPVRTATGLGLGFGYGVGLWRLFVLGDLGVLAVGTAYGLVALYLLDRQRRASRLA